MAIALQEEIMNVRRRISVSVAVLAATASVLTGCGKTSDTSSSTTSAAGKASLTFAVITHGGPGDSFWDVVKKGAEQAGKDLNIKVEYQGSGKPNEQADMINAAVSNKV